MLLVFFSAVWMPLFAGEPVRMVLQLGQKSKFIQVTPEYSNATVSATLPYFSDFAKKLDLPIACPIKIQDLDDCRILPWQDKDGGIAGVSITVKGGFAFYFNFGYVTGFNRPDTYYGLQNPDEIPKYFGRVKMSKDEAVQLARDTIKRLGISLEDVFANQKPMVTLPQPIGTNTVTRYKIEWISPRGGSSARFEINGENRQVESILFNAVENLMRPSPKVEPSPPESRGTFGSELPSGRVNPEYVWKLIPIVLKAIDGYGHELSLPIPRPLTTNNVALFDVCDNGGWPHCEITLTNGWRFIYRHAMVNGYYAPDVFVTTGNHPFHLKELEGKWNLTTNQAIELIKKSLAKLNYPTNNIHMNFSPNIIYAAGDFKAIIPRLFCEWHYENETHDDLQSKVEAEVDADNGTVKSLYYDDKSYWGNRPPIDAPISIK
jgi:20S proteasome alpha/beta subunit